MNENSGRLTPGSQPDQAFQGPLSAYWDALIKGATPNPEQWTAAHSELGEELHECLWMLQSLHESCAAIKEDSHVDDAGLDATTGELAALQSELLIPGTIVGHCRIESLLGRGGMGEVYVGVHETLGCKRAVKVLQKFLATDESARRFLKEVKALGRIGSHQNLVAATHADKHLDGRLYLEMEYWPGVDLAQYVNKHGPLPISEACDYGRQVAAGLAHLHENKVVHRDIKPSNLLRVSDGTIKILDLGLAKLTADEAIRSDIAATHAGDLLGTFDYLSPEQADDPTVADERSDLYSLGCTFFFLLTARPPFADIETRGGKLVAHIRQKPPPLSQLRNEIPDSLVAIVERLLAKDPRARYQTAKELVGHIDNCISQSRERRAYHPAVGIDLGTTNSVIAIIDRDTERPITLRNDEGELATPSAVLVDREDVIAGREAIRAWQLEPDRVAVCAKRGIGTKDVALVVDGVKFPPEVIQAYVLKKVMDDARGQVADKIQDAVISVPAYFDEVRRKATFHSAYMAGINVLDIINEPTAAALACGVGQGFLAPDGRSSRRQTILVYDLGGGTFDVTLMRIEGDEFTTLATDGDVELGGRDWDKILVDLVADHFQQHHGMNPLAEPRFAARLWQDCEDAKRTLSKRQKAVITCDFGDVGERLELNRQEFERRTVHLLERTEFTTRSVLQVAGLDWAAVDRIILVGGATRMPMVRNMLQAISGRQPEVLALPQDEAVAHGAAIYADLLMADREHRPRAYQVRNVNSHSLGVVATNATTGDSEVVVLIPRNTRLPASSRRVFKTSLDGQSSLAIPVVEGENPSPINCTRIGELTVHDLPPGLPARSNVKVSFGYSENGRLKVGVKVGDDRHLRFDLECHHGLTQPELDSWRQKIVGD